MRTFWEESVSKIFQTPSLHPKSSYCSCKNIKGCRFAGYDEIRREALKTLKRGVPWLLRVCQVTWCFGKTLKDWQTGVIIPHTRSETGKIAPTTGTYISLITLSGIMCMPNTLIRETANNWTKSGGYAPRVNLVGKLYDQHFLNTFSHIPLLVYSYFHVSFVVRCFVKIKHKYVNIIKRFSVTVTNVANMLHSKNGEVHTGP